MNAQELKKKLEGCYVTVPTPFKDSDGFPINYEALTDYVEFLLGNGLNQNNCTLLFGGAAGDFSTMTFEERKELAEQGSRLVNGRVPIALGGQTTSTLELEKLAQLAEQNGFDFLQVSCPFYFMHTEDDFIEYIRAASKAAPNVGIILYNTFWSVHPCVLDRAICGKVAGEPWPQALFVVQACANFIIRFATVQKAKRKTSTWI